MKSLSSRLMRLALAYVILVPVLGILGSMSEDLAYSFLLFSSVFFAFGIVYETWKDSRHLSEINYPSQENPRLEELETLTAIVEKAISGQIWAYNSVISHLRRILREKIRNQFSLSHSDLEKILKNPEKLRDIVEDEDLLRLLLFQVPERKKEQLEWLTRILDRLEEWGK